MNFKAAQQNSVSAEQKPEKWDGFGFFKDYETGEIKFYFFDDVSEMFGEQEREPGIPDDRDPYHVLLTSTHKGVIWVDHPFVSNFIDPIIYAARIAGMGFSGTMLRKTKVSDTLMHEVLKYTLMLHSKGRNFVYVDESGAQLTLKGKLGDATV
jgi:hypothetical protein